MADASVTYYNLSLGSQDPTTGWPIPTYTELGDVEGSIQPRGFTFFMPNLGASVARYPQTLFTADVISGRGDIVKDKFGDYYVITAFDRYAWFNQFGYYQAGVERRDFPAPTTSSGTWHLDSESLKTDPRYRHKTWLDTYLAAGNMKLDNGSTNADIKTMFSDIPYFCPAEQLVITKDYDGVMSIDKRSGKQLTTYNHYPYAFEETVPITLSAVDKTGLTATNLLEQMEQEIRHVCTDHPLGSIRSIDGTEYKSTDIGGTRLWETTVTIRYKRANDDYTATYPTLTWGPSGSPTGTYYFPNCVDIQYSGMTTDAKSHPPSFVGDIKQPQGAGPLRIKIICDLDLDSATYTWKRPQTSTPKTDGMKWQVFGDIDHNGGIDEAYQTLTLDWGSMKVRQFSYDTYKRNESLMLEVVYEEYTNTDQSGSSLATRWSIP